MSFSFRLKMTLLVMAVQLHPPCPLPLVHSWLQMVSKLSKSIQQNVCSLFQQY